MKMKPAFRLAGLALAGNLLLSACGSSEPAEPVPVKDTVFGDMEATKDRARAVGDITMQHKQSLDEAIDAQSNGGPPAAP